MMDLQIAQRRAGLILSAFLAAAPAAAAAVSRGTMVPTGGATSAPGLSYAGAFITPTASLLAGALQTPSLISDRPVSASPAISIAPMPISVSLSAPAAALQAPKIPEAVSPSAPEATMAPVLSTERRTQYQSLSSQLIAIPKMGPAEKSKDFAAQFFEIPRITAGLEDDAAAFLTDQQTHTGGWLSAAKASDQGTRARQATPLPSPILPDVPRDSRRAWTADQAAILAEAQMLRTRVDALARRDLAEWGSDRFEREIDKGGIVLEDPLLGRGEVNSLRVSGERIWFIRVTHAPTELAIYFLDQAAVPKDSPHLRQILSRQVMDAGAHRKDGKTGRNVVIAWERDGVIVAKEFHERPARLSLAWWKAFWYATYKKPASTDIWFGLLMGAVQGLLALGLGFLSAGAALSLTPVFYTFTFGALIGGFISTYKNWTYRGPWSRQFLKQALISIIFAYPVVASTLGLSALCSAAMHIHVFSNVALNNVGKSIWTQIPRIGDQHRQFTAPLLGGVSRSGAINQLFYMINWTLRLADLIHVPGGTIIFLATMPLGCLLTYWYAQAHGFPEAEQMRQAPRRWLQKFQRAARGMLQSSRRIVGR